MATSFPRTTFARRPWSHPRYAVSAVNREAVPADVITVGNVHAFRHTDRTATVFAH